MSSFDALLKNSFFDVAIPGGIAESLNDSLRERPVSNGKLASLLNPEFECLRIIQQTIREEVQVQVKRLISGGIMSADKMHALLQHALGRIKLAESVKGEIKKMLDPR